MNIGIKIAALEEYHQRQEKTNAEQAAHAQGMVAGLKCTMKAGFNYDDALIESSYDLQSLLSRNASAADIERAVGFFSGIVFSETDDIFEAQAAGYQEREALSKILRNGEHTL
jgi:hypothetical protein